MVSPLRRVPFGSRPKRNQKGLPRHPGLAALDFPHFIIAPWARCDGPSVAQRSSCGILPLNPLRNDYVRPTEGALSRPELICSAEPGVGFENLVGRVQPASVAAFSDPYAGFTRPTSAVENAAQFSTLRNLHIAG